MSLALTDRDLLDAWTASRGQDSEARLDELLGRACGAGARSPVAAWPLARRSAVLVELRIARWGAGLEGIVGCPSCGEELELSLDLATATGDGDPEDEIEVDVGGTRLRFRLPTRTDLDAVAAIGNPLEARRELARCCLLDATPASELSEEAVAAVSERMGRADPAGTLSLAASCPECEHEWEEPLDIAAFVAGEAEADVRRIAAEVHALASAYGWSEGEILDLSPARRRLYLELADG